jgi:hypothetical protein
MCTSSAALRSDDTAVACKAANTLGALMAAPEAAALLIGGKASPPRGPGARVYLFFFSLLRVSCNLQPMVHVRSPVMVVLFIKTHDGFDNLYDLSSPTQLWMVDWQLNLLHVGSCPPKGINNFLGCCLCRGQIVGIGCCPSCWSSSSAKTSTRRPTPTSRLAGP